MDSEAEDSGSVSLEEFITSNWQILTIFGVFAGITNYMSGLGSTWLVTSGVLLTFIVGLEILQLLLRIKNRSITLNAFTVLSVLFIVLFAGFIYSQHLSDMLEGFGLAVYPWVNQHHVLLLRTIFFASIMVVLLGLYRHLRSAVTAALKMLGRDKVIMAGFLSTVVLAAAGVVVLAFLSLAPEGTVPAETTTTTLEAPTTTTSSTTTSTTVTTTSSTLPPTACTTNSDCGNQTSERICYRGDVYVQVTTPLCQRPGTPEARCVYRTRLEGETIAQEATPEERCSHGCENGECI